MSDYEELRGRLKPMLVKRFTDANEGMRYLTSGRFSHGDPEQNAEGILELVMPPIEAKLRERDEHWEGQARDWLRTIDEQREQLEQSRLREAEALGLLSEVQEAGPFSPTRLVDGGVVCVWCEHPDAHADDCLIYGIEAFLESQKGGGRPEPEHDWQRSSIGLPVTGEAEVSPTTKPDPSQ